MKVDLRRASWFDRSRLNGYAKCVLAVSAVSSLWFYYDSAFVTGSDFQAFWSAARILITGGAEKVYSLGLAEELQRGMPTAGFIAFVHPPPFLLLLAPLGLLPYPVAMAVWNIASFSAWAVAATRIDPRSAWPIVAFPGALVAVAHAQTGLLCSALICGSIAAGPKRPFLAGAFIGALVIKPQIALLFPLIIVLSKQPKIFVAAAISAGVCVLIPLVAWGQQTYSAWFGSLSETAELVARADPVFLQRMCTVYSAARLTGSTPFAVVAQSTSAVGSLLFLFWVSRQTRNYFVLSSAGLTCTCLCLPYLFSYDLPFLVVPLIWVGMQGRSIGWLDWEKLGLAVAYWGVFVCRATALPVGVNATPFISVLILWLIWRRLRWLAGNAESHEPSRNSGAGAVVKGNII